MTQYLILHKVRGEPKFDTAEPMDVNGEEFWITNAGHRAYPYQKWSMLDVWISREFVPTAVELPAEWPEHFQMNDKPLAKKGKGLNLMDFITLPPPKVKLVRRRV